MRPALFSCLEFAREGKNTSYQDDADYQRIVDFAERRMNDSKRAPYNLLTNDCYDFAREAIAYGQGR
jgi:hypothetical protein